MFERLLSFTSPRKGDTLFQKISSGKVGGSLRITSLSLGAAVDEEVDALGWGAELPALVWPATMFPFGPPENELRERGGW